MSDDSYYSTLDAYRKRQEVFSSGRVFDVYNHIVPVFRHPKTIAKTGPDYLLSVHYIENEKTQPLNKSILQLAHYKKAWMNRSFYIDSRMSVFSKRNIENMKAIRLFYEQYNSRIMSMVVLPFHCYR